MSRHIDKKQSNIEIEKLIDLYGDALLRLCYLYLHDSFNCSLALVRRTVTADSEIPRIPAISLTFNS